MKRLPLFLLWFLALLPAAGKGQTAANIQQAAADIANWNERNRDKWKAEPESDGQYFLSCKLAEGGKEAVEGRRTLTDEDFQKKMRDISGQQKIDLLTLPSVSPNGRVLFRSEVSEPWSYPAEFAEDGKVTKWRDLPLGVTFCGQGRIKADKTMEVSGEIWVIEPTEASLGQAGFGKPDKAASWGTNRAGAEAKRDELLAGLTLRHAVIHEQIPNLHTLDFPLPSLGAEALPLRGFLCAVAITPPAPKPEKAAIHKKVTSRCWEMDEPASWTKKAEAAQQKQADKPGGNTAMAEKANGKRSMSQRFGQLLADPKAPVPTDNSGPFLAGVLTEEEAKPLLEEGKAKECKVGELPRDGHWHGFTAATEQGERTFRAMSAEDGYTLDLHFQGLNKGLAKKYGEALITIWTGQYVLVQTAPARNGKPAWWLYVQAKIENGKEVSDGSIRHYLAHSG